MNRITFASPGRFVIAEGEIGRHYTYTKSFGNQVLLVAHDDDAQRVGEELHNLKAQVILTEAHFGGECTHQEIQRICRIAQETGAQVVVGLGGGKAIDTAKSIGHFQQLPVIVVPTIASTDAPCSTLAVVYDEDHVFVECYLFDRNPDIVVVDPAVIAKAPVRFLAAGIGDAYATYFEARACLQSHAQNYVGGTTTKAAFALAELCRKVLLEDSEKALSACRRKIVTPALVNIVEANLLLSGLGFESVGLAAAHGLHDALTVIPDTHEAVHGEKVAIGLLAQHVLENESQEQIRETIAFYKRVGLPTCLADIGIAEDVEAKLWKIAQAAVQEGSATHNMPFPVSAEMVFSALQLVDDIQNFECQSTK